MHRVHFHLRMWGHYYLIGKCFPLFRDMPVHLAYIDNFCMLDEQNCFLKAWNVYIYTLLEKCLRESYWRFNFCICIYLACSPRWVSIFRCKSSGCWFPNLGWCTDRTWEEVFITEMVDSLYLSYNKLALFTTFSVNITQILISLGILFSFKRH